MRKALFFTLCPVVFQKHQPDLLRACPSAPGAHCPQLTLRVQCAPPWNQLTVARQGLGSGAGKRYRKCSKGIWGFSTRRKRERLLVESSERGRWKEASVPFSVIVNPAIFHVGSAPWSRPPFSFTPPLSCSLLHQLFQTCLPNHPSCFPTHIPPLPSLPPPYTIKTPILLN